MTADLPNLASMSNLNLSEASAAAGERAAERAYRRGERREHLRSVTRGVGTTLYMSPEQRASKPYDHKVDIYSAGVLLLEMSHPFSTGMERVVVLSNLQRRQLPKAMDDRPEGELILSMTDESPARRPSVDMLLASPLLAAHGHICVSVRLEEQYALMPLIRQQIETGTHTRSSKRLDTPHMLKEQCLLPRALSALTRTISRLTSLV